MSFFSGTTTIPPLGYSHIPTINFTSVDKYPTASTCTLQLTLPIIHSTYDEFKDAMLTAMLMNGGFGLC